MSVRSSQPVPGSSPSHPQVEPAAAPGTFCFSIQARAEPGIMPRVLELFAKRNIVPVRWHSDVLAGAARELAIDVQVADVTSELGSYIARCLRQIPGVATVLTAEKRPAARSPGALSA